MSSKNSGPSLSAVVGAFGLIAVIEAVGLISHDEVFAAIITIGMCGGYIVWWIWRRRYQ